MVGIPMQATERLVISFSHYLLGIMTASVVTAILDLVPDCRRQTRQRHRETIRIFAAEHKNTERADSYFSMAWYIKYSCYTRHIFPRRYICLIFLSVFIEHRYVSRALNASDIGIKGVDIFYQRTFTWITYCALQTHTENSLVRKSSQTNIQAISYIYNVILVREGSREREGEREVKVDRVKLLGGECSHVQITHGDDGLGWSTVGYTSPTVYRLRLIVASPPQPWTTTMSPCPFILSTQLIKNCSAGSRCAPIYTLWCGWKANNTGRSVCHHRVILLINSCEKRIHNFISIFNSPLPLK